MKTIGILLIIFSTSSSFAVETVKDLDLEKYKGLWHQLGAMPQRFARQCIRNTTAEYKIIEDGLIEVKNTCLQKDNTPKVAFGRARLNEDFNDNAKLEVTFAKVFGNYIFAFGGDYWVIGLDEDYQWALVGHPERSGLYILSRTTQLPAKTLKRIRNIAEDNGYDTCDTIMSPTENGPYQQNELFCDLNL